MTLNYALSENDYLQHQLFVASKKDSIKKQRIKTWLLFSGASLLLSFLFYQNGDKLMTWYFLIFGLIALCFFQLYQKWYYRRHYQKYVADIFKNRFGQTAVVKFTDCFIETSDTTGESKINLTELEKITETGDHFYLQIRTGGHLIIPKAKLDDLNAVRQELKRICEKLSIDFIEDLKWRWK
jgi:hypothetical protein